MHRFLLLPLAFIYFEITGFSQTKEYKLIAKTEKGDFDYPALYGIDTTKNRESRRSIFNPVKGKYTVYLFIATFTGSSFNNTEKDFHDILILKTNKKNKIIDVFQYTLEWAEMPLSYDLYRANAKKKILVNGLTIDKLNFRRVNYYNEDQRELKQQGVVRF